MLDQAFYGDFGIRQRAEREISDGEIWPRPDEEVVEGVEPGTLDRVA